MSQSAQDKINQIIFDNNLTEKWLSDKLGMYPQKLHYQLHEATSFDYNLYKRIMDIFRRAGIIVDQATHCNLLKDSTVKIFGQMGEEYNKLSHEVIRATQDGIIDEREKLRLMMAVDDMEERLLASLTEMREIIDGKKPVEI